MLHLFLYILHCLYQTFIMLIFSVIYFVFPAANNCVFFICFYEFLSLSLMFSKFFTWKTLRGLFNVLCHLIKNLRKQTIEGVFFSCSFFLNSAALVQSESCALYLHLSYCPASSFVSGSSYVRGLSHSCFASLLVENTL